MCGRFVLESTTTEIVDAFALEDTPDCPPRYNIAPTQPILIVRHRSVPESSNVPPREAVLARWGLIPPWAKPGDKLPLLINARSETAAQKASFRAAMKRRRVLVPISGFYEWRRVDVGARKPVLEPHYVRPRDGGEHRGGPLALAGLMEVGAGADEMVSAAIMTAEATSDFRHIHHRMPVVVGPDDYARWLDPERGPGDVADLLHAPPEGFFEPVPVSERVNKVANQGPELIVPVEREPAAPPPPAPIRERAEPDAQGSLF